ncbi:PEP-utilizing enzyme [Streptomyces goshikiensis]|uniref:PEP-utilizing enzyme n=1 Tax=Streptomyces goshikiensis TaxID=1942 RepID=UPI0036A7591F
MTNVSAQPLSHASIQARKPGIPAVVGCGKATTRVRTPTRRHARFRNPRGPDNPQGRPAHRSCRPHQRRIHLQTSSVPQPITAAERWSTWYRARSGEARRWRRPLLRMKCREGASCVTESCSSA